MSVAPEIQAAVRRMEEFVTQATGRAPAPQELADAMTRYFVLKEVLEFIQMSREDQSDKS